METQSTEKSVKKLEAKKLSIKQVALVLGGGYRRSRRWS